MEETQVKKLKLNVTNIKSFLITSNKNLKKMRLEKNRLIEKDESEEKFRKEEKRLESPINFKSPLSTIKSFILAGPMSLFDKIKEFLGIILLGILVNNLPQIIQKIKNFFNDPFVKGILHVFKVMGKGLYEIIKTTLTLTDAAQNKIKNDVKQIKKDVNYLLETFGFLERDINKDIRDNSQSSSQQSQSSSQSQSVPLTQSGAPTNPTPTTAFQPGNSPFAQAFSKGGTVKKPKTKPRKFAQGGTVTKQPKKEQQSTQKSKSSSFAKKETGKAKKARQDINYFEGFNKAVKDLSENTILDTKNNTLYEEMVNNFKKLSDMMKDDKDKTTSPGSPRTPGGAPGPVVDLAVPVDPKDVIGTLGSTGRSTGPHIHIENHTIRGGRIPLDVKNNILVSGKPLMSLFGPEDGNDGIGSYAWRRSRSNPSGFHAGEDYAGTRGSPITLKGGLKFVSFIPDDGGGYGNRVIIQAPDGTRYSLNHLDSGPRNVQELKKRQLELQQQQDSTRFTPTGQTQTGEASWYGPGFQGNKTASGERFDTNQYTAAHPTLAFGTRVKVINKSNGKFVIVKINDRGPYAVNSSGQAIRPLKPHPSRVIDLSKAAMERLGGSGVIDVELEILKEKPVPRSGQPDFIGPVPQGQRISALNTNMDDSNTIVAMVYNTQQVIQPYPVPYAVPIKTPSPSSSVTSSLVGAWDVLPT